MGIRLHKESACLAIYIYAHRCVSLWNDMPYFGRYAWPRNNPLRRDIEWWRELRVGRIGFTWHKGYTGSHFGIYMWRHWLLSQRR